MVVDRPEIDAIHSAASVVAKIYARVLRLLEQASAELLIVLGLTREIIDVLAAAAPWSSFPLIARLDLVAVDGVYKLLEINCDAPGLLVETFPINAATCEAESRVNPNAAGAARVARAYADALRLALGNTAHGGANVVVAYSATALGDRDAATYLSGLLAPFDIDARCETLRSIRADAEDIFDSRGHAIDAIVNIFPMRYLLRGAISRADGRPVRSDDWIQMLSRRRPALLNPLSVCVLESKAVQALIFALYDAGEYFTEVERDGIARHMLPTSLQKSGNTPFVMKPAFGAGGDSVYVYDGKTRFMSAGNTCADDVKVFQRYVPLPRISAMTEYGMMELSVVASCFLVGTEPSGVVFRCGTGVTNNSWWVAPVGLPAAGDHRSWQAAGEQRSPPS